MAYSQDNVKDCTPLEDLQIQKGLSPQLSRNNSPTSNDCRDNKKYQNAECHHYSCVSSCSISSQESHSDGQVEKLLPVSRKKQLHSRKKIITEEDLNRRVQHLESQLAIMNQNFRHLLDVRKASNISESIPESLLSERATILDPHRTSVKHKNKENNEYLSTNEGKKLVEVLDATGKLTTTTGQSRLQFLTARKSSCTELKKNLKSDRVLSFFQSLNLDSFRQDGSASEEIDANMEEFLRVPFKLEALLFFGFAICVDSFLHVLTVVPLKVAWSCICLICTILRPRKGIIGRCRFHRRHLYQLIRAFVIFAIYRYCLCPISIGKLYHWIRGQEMLKLYVFMAMVEVFDRLMCSLGQDALDSLYWNITRRPCHPRMVISTIVVLFYAVSHSLILLVHVATLNVAMNSADQALLSLLIGGNFAEIKSTVFKKYNKEILFKITSSDICERFKLMLFLGLVLLLNCSQGGMNQDMVNDYVKMSSMIIFAEMICDWIKHSFITKFNFIKSSVYRDYSLILARDITGVGHEGVNIDHTHAVVKQLGFAQIPLICVMARYLTEAARYADILSDAGDSNHVLYSIAVVYTRGTWRLVASIMLLAFLLLLALKLLLGHVVTSAAHKIILYGVKQRG